MSVTSERVLGMLRVHPEGMTPALMALALGEPQKNVSARLGKMSMHGLIERRRMSPHNGRNRNPYVYFLKGRQ